MAGACLWGMMESARKVPIALPINIAIWGNAQTSRKSERHAFTGMSVGGKQPASLTMPARFLGFALNI